MYFSETSASTRDSGRLRVTGNDRRQVDLYLSNRSVTERWVVRTSYTERGTSRQKGEPWVRVSVPRPVLGIYRPENKRRTKDFEHTFNLRSSLSLNHRSIVSSNLTNSPRPVPLATPTQERNLEIPRTLRGSPGPFRKVGPRVSWITCECMYVFKFGLVEYSSSSDRGRERKLTEKGPRSHGPHLERTVDLQ